MIKQYIALLLPLRRKGNFMPFVNSVFLSATYDDLVEERKAAIDAFVDMGILPFSMELFPADYLDKQLYIKQLISEADYFALIIGGKYGEYVSDNEKISFTEWEYKVAKDMDKKILAFLPTDSNLIPIGKTDQDEEKKEHLDNFIKEIKKTPLIRRYVYGNIASLKEVILKSFYKYGYSEKLPSRYCGIWESDIEEVGKFPAKNDEWTFYGRADNVCGTIRRLRPNSNERIWSFVGIEFGDQLVISFAEDDRTRKSAGVMIVRKEHGEDEKISGYYYEFAKLDEKGIPLAIPIVLKRKQK